MNDLIIYGEGGKGGGGGHTPVEASDTLQSSQIVKLLFAISEGEIDSLQDVYLNQIPAYKNGVLTTNFKAEIDFRAGTAGQTVIPGFVANESPTSGFTNRPNMVTGTDYIVSIPATATAARITLTLGTLRQILSNGDMVGYTVNFGVQVRPVTAEGAGSWTSLSNIIKSGKCSSAYSWDTNITRPAGATVSWDIKLTRNTANDSDMGAKYSSQVSWTSCINITDVVYTYPGTALVAITLTDAAQFGGSIPEIMFKPRGIKVAVPDNYNAATRVYTGSWTSLTLTTAYVYTDNPAWHIVHVLKSPKAKGGLGIAQTDIDLISFYALSQYCDGTLPHLLDGVTVNEPRYTLHNQFYARENVPTFLMYFLSLCNANFTTNEFGQISIMFDRAGQAVTKQVTNANIIGGKFSYSSNDLESRVSLVNVTYNNSNYYGRTDTATVEEADLTTRYGLQTLDIVLPGCTSEFQAIRKARWAIYNNSRLTGLTSFSTSFMGLTYTIGELVRVYDNDNNRTVQSGIILSYAPVSSTTVVTLDRLLTFPVGTSTLYCISLDGKTPISGTISSYTSVAPYTVTISSLITPIVNSPFDILGSSDTDTIVKVIKVERATNEYVVSCIAHDETKYSYIDGTTSLVTPTFDLTHAAVYVSEPVASLSVVPNFSSNGITNSAKLQVTWLDSSTKHASVYKLSWRRDNQDAILVTDILTNGYDIVDPIPGTYTIIVWAINPASSITSQATILTYAYRTTVSNSTLYPPKDIYITGTSGLTYATPNLSLSFNYDTLNDTVAVVDTLYDYVIEIWDKATVPNLKATYHVPVSSGTSLDNTLFKTFVSTATNVTKVTNSDGSVNLTKVAGGASAWDSQGYTSIGANGSCAVRFNFGSITNSSVAGLNLDASTGADLAAIDYGILITSAGIIQVFESNVNKGSFGSCVTTDIFEVEYMSSSSGVVRYKKNGQIFYTATTTNGRTFYGDSSLFAVGSNINNLIFGTYPVNINRNGLFTFSLAENIATFGVPTRLYDIKVFSRDTIGDLSNPAIVTVTNPLPATSEFTFTIINGIGSVFINVVPTATASYDIAGYKVWQCLTANVGTFVKSDSNMVYMGPDTYISLSAPGSASYTYWVAAYDSFGSTGLNHSTSAAGLPLSVDTATWTIQGLALTIGTTNQLLWAAGSIYKNGTLSGSISTGNATWTTGTLYLYYNPTVSTTVLQTTTTLGTAVASGNYPIATYTGGVASNIKGGSGNAFISGSQIIAGSVGASQLVVGSAVITGSAQIDSAVITNAHISDTANIGNAKIANDLQSSNFSSANKVGWKMDKTGSMTTYGAIKIGTQNAASGSLTNTFIASPYTLAGNAVVNGNLISKSAATVSPTYTAGPLTFTLSGTGITSTATSLIKGAGAAGFNVQGYSTQSYTNACAVQFKFNLTAMIGAMGLNTDPTLDANYTSLDYCIYNNNGTILIYESGVSKLVGGYGTFSITDVFEIEYTKLRINYKKNNVVIAFTVVAAGKTFFLDSSISTVGASSQITGISFGTYVYTFDYQGYTNETFTSACATKFVVSSNTLICGAGLATTPPSGTNYTLKDYLIVFNLVADGFARIYELGTDTGITFAFTVNDVFEIEYSSTSVIYRQNGIIKRTATTTTGRTFSFCSSLYSQSSQVSGVMFGQYQMMTTDYGARMEITGDVIKVFDSNNVLRVKLGNLA